MIPASYLFKQAYDQAWNEPEASSLPEPRQNLSGGLLMPLTKAVVTLLSRRPQNRTRDFGAHAYE
ncbi:MAG: hypothetical protein P0Y65_03820 [Candidatus Devosia phytovorans]|uniref:Uncharacterized protein n=1 Tax=Candidatus Devosia phytovorans TaxID=3121372 RepID=A0AAJ5VWC6_9HYPH|nr:hypothetical protein [Devosia sp.]WEK05395.1 MAG: hypothetical protein P0Y65_03820 [Devosia sp.]